MEDQTAFLQHEIELASSAKLRWMLIQRAVALCELIDSLWESGQASSAKQWELRVQEILNELLAGVTDPQNIIAAQVSDLYVYLNKLMIDASAKQDRDILRSVREILDIELETWSLFIEKEAVDGGQIAGQVPTDLLPPSTPSGPPQAKPKPIPAPKFGNTESGSLNLEV